MMPKGVEHSLIGEDLAKFELKMKIPMMPKGVEYMLKGLGGVGT